MTIKEVIDALEAIRAIHGDDVGVCRIDYEWGTEDTYAVVTEEDWQKKPIAVIK